MQLTLDVVASVRIRRKKPWSRLAWIGRDKESVLLIECHRVSVLFIPSGKTKRTIPKLQPFLKECVSLNYTKDGSRVFGLKSDGTIFVWHKDTNTMSQLSTKYPGSLSSNAFKWRPSLFADDDCRHIMSVVTAGPSNVEIFLYGEPDRWWQIEANLESSLRVGRELAVDVCFVKDGILEPITLCGFAYSAQSSFRFVVLRVARLYAGGASSLIHQWSSVDVPIQRFSSTARPQFRKGSYLVKWSGDGRLAAVVINQDDQDVNGGGRVLLVSTECSVLVSASLPLESNAPSRRHTWICDAQWTHDDLFLVTIRRSGSVCILCRSGDVLIIATQGCSMEFSPAQYLAIHPRVCFGNSTQRVVEDTSSTTTTTTGNVVTQRFSVSCHPSRPMFFCSDGYMATCVQLPVLVCGPHKAVYFFLREANRNLKRLRRLSNRIESRPNTAGSDSVFKPSGPSRPTSGQKKSLISWEQRTPSDDDIDEEESVCKSELAIQRLSAVGNIDQIRPLSFGALSVSTGASHFRNKSACNPFSELISDVEVDIVQCLIAGWSIVVATNDTWTLEWEARAKSVSELLVKMCHVLSHQVVKCVAVCERFLLVGRLDGTHKNTLPVMLNAIQSVAKVLLATIGANRRQPLEFQLDCMEAVIKLLLAGGEMFASTFSYEEDRSAFDDRYISTTGRNCRVRGHRLSLPPKGRFVSVWRRLHRIASKIYLSDAIYTFGCDRLVNILGQVQSEIQRCDHRIHTLKSVHVTPAQRKFFLVVNDREVVIAKWLRDVAESVQGEAAKSSDFFARRLSRQLHAILYARLSDYKLKEAIELILWLLTLTRNGVKSHDSCTVIRNTLRTFARFMSNYFVGRPLVVPPWHRPRPLLDSDHGHASKARMITLNRERVTSSLRQSGVDRNWSPDVALALLLSTGCVSEGNYLALCLGDWKTSFVLQSACTLANNNGRHLASDLQDFYVRWLMKTIFGLNELSNHDLSTLAGDISDVALSRPLEDCLLAGSLCGLNVVSTILRRLLTETKRLLIALDAAYVPDDIYLPRPPIYCPQLKEPTADEDHVLARVASILRLVRVTLSASKCVVPVVRRYLRELSVFAGTMSNDDDALKDWPLVEHLRFLEDTINSDREEQEVMELADCFRDFCSIAWFLHARDKASRHLRRFRQLLEARPSASKKSKTISKMGLLVLQWSVRMLPFAEFMGWSLDVYDCIISVLMDMPADNRSSAVLARCFPDLMRIPDELEYRVTRLLNDWRGIGIVHVGLPKSAQTKTLAALYLEQGLKMKEVMEQLQNTVGTIEEDVFVDQLSQKKIRPFEVDWEYYVFLELMLDIGFLKEVLEKGILAGSVPLVPSNRALHIKTYLLEDPPVILRGLQRSNVSTDFNIDFNVQANSTAKIGLFRSFSMNDFDSRTNIGDHRTSIGLTRVKSFTNLKDKSLTGSTTISVDILCICDAILTCRSADSKHEGLSKLLTWLTHWADKDDCISGFRDHGPRMKVRVNVLHILNAVCEFPQVLPPSSPSSHENVKEKDLSEVVPSKSVNGRRDIDWSLTQVTPAKFLTSTPAPIHSPSEAQPKLIDDATNSWKTRTAPAQNTNKMRAITNDLQSEYVSRLQKLQDIEDETSNHSSTLGVSPLPSDVNGEKESLRSLVDMSTVQFRDSSRSSCRPNSPATVSTSRRTDEVNEVSRAASEKSTRRIEAVQNGDELDGQLPTSDNGMEKEVTKKSQLVRRLAIRRVRKSDKSDDSHASNGPPLVLLRLPAEKEEATAQRLIEEREFSTRHRKARIYHQPSDSAESKNIPPGYIPPLLRLQTPTSVKLIPPEELRNYETKLKPEAKTKPEKKSKPEVKSRPLLNMPTVEVLPEFYTIPVDDTRKTTIEIGVGTSDSFKQMKSAAIDAYTNTEKVVRERSKCTDVAIGPAHINVKKSVSVGTNASIIVEKLSIGVGTETPLIEIPKTATPIPTAIIEFKDLVIPKPVVNEIIAPDVKKSVSVGTNVSMAVDKISVGVGSEWPLVEIPRTVAQAVIAEFHDPMRQSISVLKDRQSNEKFEAVKSFNHQNTQTELNSPISLKGSSSSTPIAPMDAPVNTKWFTPPSTDRRNRSPISLKNDHDDHMKDTVWTSLLNGTGRAIYRKIELADDATRKLHKDMINTKKYIERLERLELDGLLNRPFPAIENLKMAEKRVVSEQRWTYAKELSERDSFIGDDDEKREPPRPKPKPQLLPSASVPVPTKRANNSDPVMTSQRMEEQKNELRAWMRRKSTQRHRDYRQNLESMRCRERQPFVSSNMTPVRTRDIARSIEERTKKNVEMALSHLSTRKDEAMKLLGELQSDKVFVSSFNNRTKQVSIEPSGQSNNRTYVLNRGLIPVNRDEQKTNAWRNKSRQEVMWFNDRQQAEIHRKESRPSHRNIGSRSPSCDTPLSSWSLPDEVRVILYGVNSEMDDKANNDSDDISDFSDVYGNTD